ncbi:type 1 glutamine amidotransferase [Candidatus Micrarchaeota archaeon]|nr:type 1 glutamine amidotransferase [Candidatus Micrarchaeota archaeon]
MGRKTARRLSSSSNGRKILIVKNAPHEGPGLIAQFLKTHGVPHDVVDLGETEFPKVRNYSAVIVLGGPDSANDNSPKMKLELERIRQAIASGKPFLGVCLGMQALVKAAGGTVVANKVKEIGFRDHERSIFGIEKTMAGRKDPLLAGLENTLNIFHLHGETVAPADGMAGRLTVLATGRHCHHQIVRVGRNAWGIQGHFELTPGMLRQWHKIDGDLNARNLAQLRKDYAGLREQLESNCNAIVGNFLKRAGVL